MPWSGACYITCNHHRFSSSDATQRSPTHLFLSILPPLNLFQHKILNYPSNPGSATIPWPLITPWKKDSGSLPSYDNEALISYRCLVRSSRPRFRCRLSCSSRSCILWHCPDSDQDHCWWSREWKQSVDLLRRPVRLQLGYPFGRLDAEPPSAVCYC